LHSDVLVATEEISAGNEPGLAAQVIDKTLQRFFFLFILDRISSVYDDFDTADSTTSNEKWTEAKVAFEAIKATAARENRVISADRQSINTGNNPGLDMVITEAFERGTAALSQQDPAEDKIEISIVRQIIRLSLARTYYIGVLREVDGIITNRDREEAEAREKQKEGEFFYRIIEDFITRNNVTGSEQIKFQLAGDLDQVSADAIVSELNKGFLGRARAELDANESSIADNRGRAMEVAEEALLYASIFADDLELRLDSGARNTLVNALSDLREASNATDIAKAVQARQTASDILSVYEQELAVADYQKSQAVPFVDAAVNAFQTISSLRRQNPVDAQAIQEAYTGELQQLTQIIDEIYSLTLDSDIQTAINAIGSGQQIPLAVQIIDKTLQRVFALTVYNRVTLVLDSFNELSTLELELEWDRAFTAFQAIKGTAARENKVLTADRQAITSGSNPYLDSQVTLAFIRGKNIFNKASADSKNQLAIERERIVLPLVRSFVIGVLREVEGILENRGRDIGEALEKQTEGIHFYQIVESFIGQHNPEGNAVIKAQLTGDLSAVDADRIVSEISRGLIGQFNAQLTHLAEVFNVNRDQSILTAEIAAQYMQMMLPDLALRLDSTYRVRMENALQDLREASANGDRDKALSARQNIIELISTYEVELI